MRKIELRKKGIYIMGGVLIAVMSLFGKGDPALAASTTCGYYTITTNGKAEEDYEFDSENNILTIKSATPITVGGHNYTEDDKERPGHIAITGSSDVYLTINNLEILHMEYGKLVEAPIQIDDSYTGTVTITIKGTGNHLTGFGAPAIQKNGTKSRLVLTTEDGTADSAAKLIAEASGSALPISCKEWPAVIGGADGESTGNITIDGGTYIINSYSSGACIGGGSSDNIGEGGDATNITIKRGIVEATLSSKSNNLYGHCAGAVIGGGGNGNADGIYIHGGTVTAINSPGSNTDVAGAAIGGGCNGNGRDIVIDGGDKITAKVTSEKCGAAIGSGNKTVASGSNTWQAGSTISISGGSVYATGIQHSGGIGGYGYRDAATSENYPDNAIVTITGGLVSATGGAASPGLGGGRYSSAEIYIRGGSVKATKGANASSAIGLENDTIEQNKIFGVYKSILQRAEDDEDTLNLQSVTNSDLAGTNSLVDVKIIENVSKTKVSDSFYGTHDMRVDQNGTVYVYLPEGYTLESITKAGEKKVDLTQIVWDYKGPYYYKNEKYELVLKTVPEGAKVVKYTNNIQSEISQYGYIASVYLEADEGYQEITESPASTYTWNIEKYTATPTLTYNGDTEKKDVYDGPVVIKASGYYIDTDYKGTFASDSIEITESNDVKLYFKEKENGYITTDPMEISITIEKNTDDTPPCGKIEIDGQSYDSINSIATQKVHLSSDTVTITATDEESGVKSIQYALYKGNTIYSTEALIENAGLSWKDYSSFTFTRGDTAAIYAKIKDNSGNVSYISTPVISDDSTAPVVKTVLLETSESDYSLDYSIEFDEKCNYSYVLLKEEAQAPADAEAIKSSTGEGGNKGEGAADKLSGTFENLLSNQSYVLYVAADDGQVNLKGTSNPNVSAVTASDKAATLQTKTVLSLDTSSVTLSDKVYDGNAISYSGTIKWVDQNNTAHAVSGTDITFTGTEDSGDAYEESSIAPINAGTYNALFKISDNDNYYEGRSTIAFKITKKDLSSDMAIKWYINGELFDESKVYYADGDTYTVTVDGYPQELVPVYTDNSENTSGTYVTAANYTIASGYLKDNYIIPGKSILNWSLSAYDNIAPTGEISINETKTYSTINTNTNILRIHENSLNAVFSGTDNSGEIKKIEYAFSGDVLGTKEEIADANLVWNTGTGCKFADNSNQALYVRITDAQDNVAYVSTPVFYNDTKAPSVSAAALSEASETTVKYSITLSEEAFCYAVLLKSSEAAPESISDIKTKMSDNQGIVNSDNKVKTLTGTFDNLDANETYILYTAADDGAVDLNNNVNANSSGIMKSSSITTKQKEIEISDQTYSVTAGMPARTYSYDLEKMISATGKDVSEFGAITYTAAKGSDGSIISDELSISGSELTIPVGTGFGVGDSQTITVNFEFSNKAYKNTSAKLIITPVAKKTLYLSGLSVVDKEYDAAAYSYQGSITWEDSDQIKVSGITANVQYQGTTAGGESYSSSTAPTKAGSYKLTIGIPQNNETYISDTYTFTFKIEKKKLDSTNVVWYINNVSYDPEGLYYADGTKYTVSVVGYSNEITPVYGGVYNSDKAGTYQAEVGFGLKSGLDADNYELPANLTLGWELKYYDIVEPVGSIVLNGIKTYDTINNTTAVEKIHETEITAVISGEDEHSDTVRVEYAVSSQAYRNTDSIIKANLNWTEGSVYKFTKDSAQALYARITDEAGNISYVSTPIISLVTTTPKVNDITLSNQTDTSIDYSFTLSEKAYYYAVLLKSNETAPKNIEEIEKLISNGNQGKKGEASEVSNTFNKLDPNQTYVLYVAADNGAKSLLGAANVSAVKMSNSITTKQKEIQTITDKLYYVKTDLPAQVYTYDLESMLSGAGVVLNDLGTITYTAVKDSGSIITDDVKVEGSVLSIPVGQISSVGISQNISINFFFGNTAYKSASAKIIVKTISKTPVHYKDGVIITSKTYDGTANSYSGTPVWVDENDNIVQIDKIELQYTGKTASGDVYDSANAPTDAGDYILTMKIPDDNSSYAGSTSIGFSIYKKDLTDIMSNVRWKINNEYYNSNKIYYANGSTYRVELTGGPEEITTEYSGEYSAEEAGEYKAVATFKTASGYKADNYIFPVKEELSWKLTKKQDIEDVHKTTPEITDVKWLYYKDDILFDDDSEFVEDGSTYRVELDTSVLPESIDKENIIYENSVGSLADSYETTVHLSVIDEVLYNEPDDLKIIWEIRKEKSDDTDIVNEKKDIDMTGYRWVYINNGESAAYKDNTILYQKSTPYYMEITNLPQGVSVDTYTTVSIDIYGQESGTVDNSQIIPGEYKTTATFKVDDPDNYNVPEPISVKWNISLSYDESPVPVKEDPVVPTVGSITTVSSAKYKVLTASEQGGTVEYEGQEKVNKKVTKITVPATISIEGKTYKVTAIKNGVFNGYKKLKNVTIGKNVVKIGDKAFYKCVALKSVIIPANVTTIGKNAFYGCKKLSKITIKSKKLKKVGNNAIKGIYKKATIKCPTKKLAKQYKKKLFKSKTGYKKTMKIK